MLEARVHQARDAGTRRARRAASKGRKAAAHAQPAHAQPAHAQPAHAQPAHAQPPHPTSVNSALSNLFAVLEARVDQARDALFGTRRARRAASKGRKAAAHAQPAHAQPAHPNAVKSALNARAMHFWRPSDARSSCRYETTQEAGADGEIRFQAAVVFPMAEGGPRVVQGPEATTRRGAEALAAEAGLRVLEQMIVEGQASQKQKASS